MDKSFGDDMGKALRALGCLLVAASFTIGAVVGLVVYWLAS